MKRQVLSFVFAATLLVIATVYSAHAGLSSILTAKVPFAFSVGDLPLPAGDYKLRATSEGLLTIQSADTYRCVLMTFPGTLNRKAGEAKLVFHRYGEQYFLSEIFNGLDDSGRRFPVSKLEREHIKAGAHSVASNSHQPEIVVLALGRQSD